MKVTNNSIGANIQNIGTAKQKATDNAGRAKTEMGAGDVADSVKVNVSDRAQAFQKAKEIASDQSVDEAKVARLQKMIDEGNYSIDASAIADRMVDEHLNFPD